jgi:hypothetical protein
MIDFGHWTTSIEHNDVIPFGFIYRITCKVNNKQYIGKKQCQSVRKRPPLKGKKNKRCSVVETDWRVYTSSSNELNNDIVKYGKDQFTFEIIKFCDSKFALAYDEAKIQFEEEVLLKEGFYNGIINLRVSRPKNANRSKNTDT